METKLNFKYQIGMERFYSVEWNGGIYRWDLIKNSKDEGKWYRQTSLMKRNEADEWILNPDEPTSVLGKINLSDNYVLEKMNEGKFFPRLEDAIPLSKELWEKYYAPKSLWEVIEIFDDVEIKVISKPLSRAEAKRELRKYQNRPYVSYDIRKYERI